MWGPGLLDPGPRWDRKDILDFKSALAVTITWSALLSWISGYHWRPHVASIGHRHVGFQSIGGPHDA